VAVASILELQLKPDTLDTALKVIHETLAATRTRPGCLGVTVLVDSADPTHVSLYEAWESIEHDDAYRAWRASDDPAAKSDLGSVLAAPLKLAVYTIADGV
jgi:quinol monooxygenase YgiN